MCSRTDSAGSSSSRRRRSGARPAQLAVLLAALACLLGSRLPRVAAQGVGPGPGPGPLDNVFTNAIAWCADPQGVTPVPPVSALTVQCSNNQPIAINLAFSFDNLGSPIPPVIAQLSQLTSLILVRNNIGQFLPQQFTALNQLKILRLDQNNLTSPWPQDITFLQNIMFLNLSTNSFQEPLPPSFGRLGSLLSLDLDRSGFLGPVPPQWTGLTAITTLHLSGIQLNSVFPDPLLLLLTLVDLTLDDSGLTGSLPDSISTLQKLTRLSLALNDFVGSIPLGLSALTSIQSLVLSDNSFSSSIPAFLGTLDLKTLALNSNLFSGTVPALSSIQSFNLLDISYNLLYGTVSYKGHPVCSGNLDKNCFSFVACPGKGSKNGGQLFRQSDGCNATCNTAGPLCTLPLAAVVDSAVRYCSSVQYGAAKSGHAGLSCLFGSPFMLDVTQYPRTVQIFSNLGLSVPDSISLLTNLGALVLDDSSIGGSVPSILTTLQGLVVLSMTGNSLVGSIPSFLSALAALTELNLDNNKLTGTIPDSLSLNANLGLLQLQYNRLYGTIPASLVSMSKLANLFLDNNQLSGNYPLNAVSAKLLSSGGAYLVSNFIVSFTGNTSALYATPADCSPFATSTAQNCFNASISNLFSCPWARQRDPIYACRLFCKTNTPTGMCGGKGYCFLDPDTSVPTCDCFDGYKTDPGSPGNCILGSIPASPPPPPPDITVTRYFGYNQSTPPSIAERFLNRWTRHLSRGYVNVNGAPAWNILSLSNWIAEENQFAPNIPLPSLPNKWTSATDQGNCSSCYAVAVSDSVAAAATLVTGQGGTISQLSTQLILQCGVDNLPDVLNNKGCVGGVTPNALDLVVQTGLRPISSFSSHPSCSAYQAPTAPIKVLMYEKVLFSGWFGLLLAVGAQPVVVTIEASYVPFQLWNSNPDHTNVFLDSNCYSGSLDHTVLIVGYQLLSPTPYWIIRNSWGPDWGDSGYIRVGIQGASFSGICGLYVYPGFYPVPAPLRGDPCYIRSYRDGGQDIRSMSPCGGGACSPRREWGDYSYTCDCSLLKDFVAANNTVRVTGLLGAGLGITQTCVPVDACRISLYNPCGVGTCMNDGRGSYFCLCPLAFVQDTLSDGSRVCSCQITIDMDPNSALANLTRDVTFTTQGSLSCYEIYVSYALSQAQFLAQNPNVDCSVPVPSGTVLNVSNPSYAGCATPYTISKSDDSCSTIADKLGISQDNITAANPGLNCTNLIPNLLICAILGTPQPLYPCLTQYQVAAGDTCSSIIQSQFAATGALRFYSLNPGVNCDSLSIAAQQSTSYGQQFVCLTYSDPGTITCKGKIYNTVVGDTCQKIVNKGKVKNQNQIKPATVCGQSPAIKTGTPVCLT